MSLPTPLVYRSGKKKRVFGRSLEVLFQESNLLVPHCLFDCIHFLKAKKRLETLGLFRVSAVQSDIQKVKDLYTNPSEIIELSCVTADPHVVACAFKGFFAESSSPLIPFSSHDVFVECFDDENNREERLKKLITELPVSNRYILAVLIRFLKEICELNSINKMTAENVGMCFGPNLLREQHPKQSTLLLQHGSKITTWLIKNYDTMVVLDGANKLLETSLTIRGLAREGEKTKEKKKHRHSMRPQSRMESSPKLSFLVRANSTFKIKESAESDRAPLLTPPISVSKPPTSPHILHAMAELAEQQQGGEKGTPQRKGEGRGGGKLERGETGAGEEERKRRRKKHPRTVSVLLKRNNSMLPTISSKPAWKVSPDLSPSSSSSSFSSSSSSKFPHCAPPTPPPSSSSSFSSPLLTPHSSSLSSLPSSSSLSCSPPSSLSSLSSLSSPSSHHSLPPSHTMEIMRDICDDKRSFEWKLAGSAE